MYTAILPAAVLLSVGTMLSARLPVHPQVMESYGKLPLSFEANQGQTDQQVKFLARGPGYSLFLTGDSAVLSLRQQKTNAVLRMKLLGANAHAAVAGANELPGKSNYFTGSDPKQWRTNVPTYGAVKYAGVYPGIDLVYHGDQRLLEYDFVLAPGADPRAIDLRFQGARKLTVNDQGALVISVGGSKVIEHAPVVYQEIGGQRKIVAGRYVLRGKGRVGFSVPEYDRNQPLVIDPTLVYSTYLGGNHQDLLGGFAVDASGNAYMTGIACSINFPTTPGAFQTTGQCTAFVTKLNASGSALVYSTHLGGYGDFSSGVAVDASGNAYVTGATVSPNFPTTPGAFQTKLPGFQNAFVTKLNPAGSSLVYSTFLGGSRVDIAEGSIAIDPLGNAYVAGETWSSDFPVTPGAFQTIFGGDVDTFVTKLNATGSALVYSTYLGGTAADVAFSIVVDSSGKAYVTGNTCSSDFPTTPGAFRTSAKCWDIFASKLNTTGSALVYSTVLGVGANSANGGHVAVDASGDAYITGSTPGNFPTTPGALQTIYGGGPNDVFIAELNAAGSALIYATYLGGSGDDLGSGIAIDAGIAYVTGVTSSSDFPTTPGAFQTTNGGDYDVFVVKLNTADSALVYSTYLGGSGGESGGGIVVDAAGNAYVTGITSSSDFPTTPGAFQTAFHADVGIAFASKWSLGTFIPPGPISAANLSGLSGNAGWYLGPVTVTLSATDPSNPISAIYYSLDGGPYQGYGAAFPISSAGIHQLLFYSVDTAGLREIPHGQTILIDITKPVSRVAALSPAATSPNFSVQWSGTDATSGVGDFTIYVSDNGSSFSPWLNQTTATQAWFVGSLGHTYGFYSIAQDIAGNREFKTAADAITQVPAQMSGDINGDGKIDCADLALVKAAFGKRTGQPGFNPAADVNHDGVVDVRDLAIVSQKLIPRTTCP
jgi:hypothetical protein